MSTDAPQRPNGLELSDIIPFASNNQAHHPDADNPMNAIMAFLNKGMEFGMFSDIMSALQGGMNQIAGIMPGGSGVEPAVAAQPTMAPTLDVYRNPTTPGMGGPSA